MKSAESEFCYLKSSVGLLRLEANTWGLTKVIFSRDDQDSAAKSKNVHLIEACSQFSEYFEGKRQGFDVELAPQGTEFQLKVWKALSDIPFGTTNSYKDIAELVGCPKGARAIGMANNKNPLPIIVPCHRVIGHSGKMVGYAGGLDIKTHLLRLEGLLEKD